MSNKHTVATREIIISYRQRELLRKKDVRTALWLEACIIDLHIRKAKIILKYYLHKHSLKKSKREHLKRIIKQECILKLIA